MDELINLAPNNLHLPPPPFYLLPSFKFGKLCCDGDKYTYACALYYNYNLHTYI